MNTDLRESKTERVITFIKAMVIGGTMLIPGVSGGSMAIILGVYNKLITAVSSFFKHKRLSVIFLAIFLAGGVLGMVLFAMPLEKLLNTYRLPTMYFFIGAVVGGTPLIIKEAKLKSFSPKIIIYTLVGMVLVGGFEKIPTGWFDADPEGFTGFLILTLAGFIGAIALVLPGISVSYMLLLMGLYEEVIGAIKAVDVFYLLPMIIGLGAGVITTTWILETLMTKHPQGTYLIILGFVLGSVAGVWPGAPGGMQWLACILTFILGTVIILFISGKELSKVKKGL